MTSYFLLLFLTSTVVRAQTDSSDALINYQCMNDQVLIVHSKTGDYIKMHCGKPAICGEVKKCALSNVGGGQCTRKGNYLQGVFENSDKSVNANCCNYVPDSSSHVSDRCTAQEIYDRPEHVTHGPLATNTAPSNDSYMIVNDVGSTAPGDDQTTTVDSHFIVNGATTEDPHLIINDINAIPQVQANLDPKVFDALTDYMRKHDPNFQWSDILLKNNDKNDKHYKRLKRAVLGFGAEKPLFLGNIDAYIASYTAPPYGHADMKLYKLTDTQKPFEIVKAIEKIPHGYRVTSCEVICSPPQDATKSPKRKCRRKTTAAAATTEEYDDEGCVIIRSTASPSTTQSTTPTSPTRKMCRRTTESSMQSSTMPQDDGCIVETEAVTSPTSTTSTSTTTTPTRKICRRTTSSSTPSATTPQDDGCVIIVDTDAATSPTSSSSSTTTTVTTPTTTTSTTSSSTTTRTSTSTTTRTSTRTSTSTSRRSTLRDTIAGGCRLISHSAAAKMRELLRAGKLLHQTPIPGYTQPGRHCKGAIDKGCVEKCLQVLETRFKNAHCQARTGNCICDQDPNSANFEQNLRDHHFDPYNPKCCGGGGGGANNEKTTPTTKGLADPSKVTPNPDPSRRTPTPPACFSAQSIVQTKKRGPVKMIDLKANEEVLTLSNDDGSPAYEPVEWFYHRDVDKRAKFLKIETEQGNILTLTENHLLPTFDCSKTGQILKSSIDQFTDSYSRFARRAKAGDCLLSIDQNSGALSIDVVKQVRRNISLTGIFSPITKSGTIIVNNVHASCYSSVENQLLQRSMHNFLIKFTRLLQYAVSAMDPLNVLSFARSNGFDKNIPFMLHYMLKVANYVLPSNIA